MKLSAKSVFRKKFNGNMNMMTPDVLEYGNAYETEDMYVVYEISEGRGFNGEAIFGVTFLEVKKGSNEIERMNESKMCHSLSEAKRHVQWLIEEGDVV